ncbi:lipoyl(octanoyl) transferase LipB [Georgenia phoenicis]|uniref:lipoyl(octanoyl) transferase LipB n=1 Tax=unclassified Georgenia TaxID=2626815 RepID=UPI0039B0139A
MAQVDFREVWALQREVHDDVVTGRRPDTVLLLEHASVYTAGRRTARAERPTDGSDVVDVDRGGRLTWHGPGQLVAYPIVRLADPVDVVAYIRALEQAVIDTAAEWGVAGGRVPGRSGVWVTGTPDRKLAAVGVRVARGVTMHGVAINADADLSPFAAIVPCGISDAGVTSLNIEAGRRITPVDVADAFEQHLATALTPCLANPALLATTPNGDR